MRNLDTNPQAKMFFTFAFAFTALILLVLATQVSMPMKAIFVAIAVSDIILLGLILLGDKFPGRRS